MPIPTEFIFAVKKKKSTQELNFIMYIYIYIIYNFNYLIYNYFIC